MLFVFVMGVCRLYPDNTPRSKTTATSNHAKRRRDQCRRVSPKVELRANVGLYDIYHVSYRLATACGRNRDAARARAKSTQRSKTMMHRVRQPPQGHQRERMNARTTAPNKPATADVGKRLLRSCDRLLRAKGNLSSFRSSLATFATWCSTFTMNREMLVRQDLS